MTDQVEGAVTHLFWNDCMGGSSSSLYPIYEQIEFCWSLVPVVMITLISYDYRQCYDLSFTKLVLSLSIILPSSAFVWQGGDRKVVFRVAQYWLPQLPQVKYVWVSVQSRICELIPASSLTYSQERTVVTDVGPLSCCKLRPTNSFRTFSFNALLGPIYWSFLLNVCRCSWPSYCAYYACWRWHQHLRLLYVTLRKPIASADKLALGGGLFYMPQLVSVPIFREFRLTPFF
jgi:hypothetical protein